MKRTLLLVCFWSLCLGTYAQENSSSEWDNPEVAPTKVEGLPGTVVIKVKEEDILKQNKDAEISVCHNEIAIDKNNAKAVKTLIENTKCFKSLKAESVQNKNGETTKIPLSELDQYDASASWYFYYYNYNYSYNYYGGYYANNYYWGYRPCYYYGGYNYHYNYYYYNNYGGYRYYYYRWRW